MDAQIDVRINRYEQLRLCWLGFGLYITGSNFCLNYILEIQQ